MNEESTQNKQNMQKIDINFLDFEETPNYFDSYTLNLESAIYEPTTIDIINNNKFDIIKEYSVLIPKLQLEDWVILIN